MADLAWVRCSGCAELVRGRSICLCCELVQHAAPGAGDFDCSLGQFRALSIHWFLQAPRYVVRWGYCFEEREEFADFRRALDCYAFHAGDCWGRDLHGVDIDADCDEDGYFMTSDGLTENERAARDAC